MVLKINFDLHVITSIQTFSINIRYSGIVYQLIYYRSRTNHYYDIFKYESSEVHIIIKFINKLINAAVFVIVW